MLLEQQQKNQNCSISARRIHTIRMFDVYLKKALRGNIIQDRPLAIDSLPEWGHHIISGFLESRRRDGMAEKTIVMCRSAGNNFFQYLEKNGICSPHGITPEIVKEFHFQDHHSTPESKNAYMIKLRQLLNYMADEGLVPATVLLDALLLMFFPMKRLKKYMSIEARHQLLWNFGI